MSRTGGLLCFAIVILVSTTVAGSEETSAQKGDSGRRLELAPAGDLYAPYIADPQHSGFGLQIMSFSSSQIADSGDDRFGLKLGGRFGIFKMLSKIEPNRGFQLSIEAGFLGQFDRDHSQDNIGWDGIYGLILTYRHNQKIAFKLGVHHTSSHVGDELQERTGRLRINYTREELIAGVRWEIARRWRTYFEAGWGYELRTDLQEPGRLQLGVEHEREEFLWKNRLGWFAAVNVSTTEERDWDLSTTVQVGFKVRGAARFWRLGLEYYDGRSWLGEFFQDDETYTSLGLWLDL